MKRILIAVLALSCLCVAQQRRIPSLPVNNVPVDDNDAVTKKYVDDRVPPLATNGTNCPVGQFPRGVDTFGNAEDCTAVDTTTDLTWPLTSDSANPATVGQFRLSYADAIAWRNALNSANYTLSPDSDGNLVWSGNGFLASGTGAAYWEGTAGTPSDPSTGKCRMTFSSTGDRPVWQCDGGSLETLAFASEAVTPTAYYDIPLAFAGTPTTSEVIGGIIVVRTTNFSANFSGSSGYIGTNPTSSFVISVKDNGSEIGTITISTLGVFTFATSGGTSKSVSAGHRLEFVAPAADATAAYILATLAGTN